MGGLWRNGDVAPEGKFLVQRRDGTSPEWPYFVIAASDPAAPAALRAYADAAEQHGMDAEYVADVRSLADQFVAWREAHSSGEPDAPPHRVDDPAVVAKMAAREA